ncbi:MAG: hypothetical protein QF535_05700 [Anaerolineales bacterium]|nr:hypothetical protein [Anaerolineales bacterium]
MGRKLVDKLVAKGTYKEWEENGHRYVSNRVITAGKEEGTYGDKGTNKVVSFWVS